MSRELAPGQHLRIKALAVFAAAAALGGAMPHNANQITEPGGVHPQLALGAAPDLAQAKEPPVITALRDPYPDPVPGILETSLPRPDDDPTVTIIPSHTESTDTATQPAPASSEQPIQDDRRQSYTPPAPYSPGETSPSPVIPEEPYEEPSETPGEGYPEVPAIDEPVNNPLPEFKPPQPVPGETNPAVAEQSIQLAREAFRDPSVPKHVVDGLLLIGSGKDGEYWASDPVVFPGVDYQGVVVSIGPDPRTAGSEKPEPAFAYYPDPDYLPIFAKPEADSANIFKTDGPITIDPGSDKAYGSFTDAAGRNFGKVLELTDILKPGSSQRLAYDKGGDFVVYPREPLPSGTGGKG